MESDEDDWSPLDYWEFYATEAWKADSEEVEVPEGEHFIPNKMPP